MGVMVAVVVAVLVDKGGSGDSSCGGTVLGRGNGSGGGEGKGGGEGGGEGGEEGGGKGGGKGCHGGDGKCGGGRSRGGSGGGVFFSLTATGIHSVVFRCGTLVVGTVVFCCATPLLIISSLPRGYTASSFAVALWW